MTPEEQRFHPNPNLKHILWWLSDNTMGILFTLVLIVLLTGTGIVIFLALRANGDRDYCYITRLASPSTQVTLIAHRPWRTDTYIAAFNSVAEPEEMAARIGCPLR